MFFLRQNPLLSLAIGLIFVFVAYRTYDELTRSYPDSRPNMLAEDVATYATYLVFEPEAFQKDPLYQTQEGIPQAKHAQVYLQTLRLLYNWQDQDIERAFQLYVVLVQAIYLVSMMAWLYYLTHNAPLALGLSFLSMTLTSAIWGTQYWGFDYIQVLPFHVFTALIPAMAGLVALAWSRQEQGWLVGGAGLLIGATLWSIHSVTGVALVEFGLLFGGLLFLSRQLPLKTYLWFAGGLLLAFPVYFSLGNASAEISWASSQAVIEWGQFVGLIYPWQLAHLDWLPLEPDLFWHLFLGGHLLLSGLFFLWLSRWEIPRWGWVAFILLQTVYVLMLVRLGWIPLALAGVGIYQVWRGERDKLNFWLLCAAIFGLMLGPLQQLVVYQLWKLGELPNLTGYVYEMSRFGYVFFICFYSLLARMLWQSLKQISSPALQSAVLLPVLFLIWGNLNSVPRLAIPTGFERNFFQNIGLTKPATATTPDPNDISPNYLAVMNWLKTETPPNSLIHITSLDRSLRYYAVRPMLIAKREWVNGTYTAIDPLTLRALERALVGQAQFDPQTLLDLLIQYQVDYLVVNQRVPSPPLQFVAGRAALYENPDFTVYAVVDLLPEQTPLTDYPALYAQVQAHELSLDLPAEAVIFNPATGNVANRWQMLTTMAEFAQNNAVSDADLDLLQLFQGMDFEAQLPAADQLVLADWRLTKESRWLIPTKVDYLLISQTWQSYLSETEFAPFADPTQYQVVGQWFSPALNETYFLYQVMR